MKPLAVASGSFNKDISISNRRISRDKNHDNIHSHLFSINIVTKNDLVNMSWLKPRLKDQYNITKVGLN